MKQVNRDLTLHTTVDVGILMSNPEWVLYVCMLSGFGLNAMKKHEYRNVSMKRGKFLSEVWSLGSNLFIFNLQSG